MARTPGAWPHVPSLAHKWSDLTSFSLLSIRATTQTRYLIKAHPGRQWLVLKVTDDFTVRLALRISQSYMPRLSGLTSHSPPRRC